MKALYHIVCESSEAANAVLCGPEGEHSDKTGDNGLHNRTRTSARDGSVNEELQAQHPLLKRLFQLMDQKFLSNAGQREAVVNSSLRTMCALAEGAEENQLWRYVHPLHTCTGLHVCVYTSWEKKK